MVRNNLENVINILTSKKYVIRNVFDIGANKGNWTAKYESKLPNAQFFLFEANPKHCRPKKIDSKHKWFNVALSKPETTTVNFYSQFGTGDSYYKEQTRAYDTPEVMNLTTITLDELIKTKSLPFPQLIKLDTQGSELDILLGAKNVITHVDIIVTEMPILKYNKGAPSFDNYINFLTDSDFVPVGVEEIHIINNLVVQIDMVFLRKSIKVKYYGDDNFFNI